MITQETTDQLRKRVKTPVLSKVPDDGLELHKPRENVLPFWIRAPKDGPEWFSGFSRSKLYQLVLEGHIRSVSIREPGQTKGTRLFHLGSILQYIDQQEQAQQNISRAM